MLRHGLFIAAATLITVVFIAACNDAQPTTPPAGSPEPPEEPTTRKPGPTPSIANTPTFIPAYNETSTSEVAETPVSSDAQGPDVALVDGLYSGELIPEPGQPGLLVPWLTMRVRPGDDPDEDPWRLESGPRPLLLPPVSSCTPERQSGGWELSDCTGIGWDLTAFMPAEGDGGLEITVRSEDFVIGGVLARIAPRDEPQSTDNVSVLWRQPGEGLHTDIWADDGLVFAPRYDGMIEIIDAEDGKIIGQAEGWNAVLDVKAMGEFLYAATSVPGLLVFDISDPSAPELIGSYEGYSASGDVEGYTSFHNIFLSPDGRFVYVADYSTFPKSGLLIIDVSDPAAPTEAGRFTIATDTYDSDWHVTHDINVVQIDGRLIAFLNYLSAGLWILDVTDPANVSALGSITWEGIFSHSGWPFFQDGRWYYAHNSEGYDKHMTVLDVTDMANPTVVSRFATREGVSIHNVEVVDGIAYISYYLDGLRVVDLRDPHSPEEIAHFDTVPDANERGLIQGAFGVRVMDGVVYVSDIEAGIYAFRVDID